MVLVFCCIHLHARKNAKAKVVPLQGKGSSHSISGSYAAHGPINQQRLLYSFLCILENEIKATCIKNAVVVGLN